MLVLPRFRMTLYAEDDETVLTPRAGASHAEEFKVATAAGVTGFRAYMGFPTGRRGRLDLLKRKVDTGSISVRVLDKGAQSAGWLTAFVGDSFGRVRLGGRRAVIETDVGDGWEPYAVGRTSAVRTDGRLWIAFEIRDNADDLERRVFGGAPHASISYARPAPLFPVGFTGDPYGPVDVTPRVKARVGTWSASGIATGTYLEVLESEYMKGSGAHKYGTVVTKAFHDLAAREATAFGQRREENLRVRLKILDGARAGEEGHFFLDSIYASGAGAMGPLVTRLDGNGQRRLDRIAIESMRNWLWTPLMGDANYIADPPAGATVEFDVVAYGVPTEGAPLFLVDVHPVQLWKDLLDGKFGRLGEGVLDEKGSTKWSVAYDADAFAALIADPSFGTGRFRIEEPADDMREWIEENLCLPYGLAYYLDREGRVVPVDLRLTNAVTPVATLTDTDLVTGSAPTWEHSIEGSVTVAEARYWVEREVSEFDIANARGEYPDIPASKVDTFENLVILRNFVAASSKERAWKIEAGGYRAFVKEGSDPSATLKAIESRLQRVLEDGKAAYASGPMTTAFECRRTSATQAVREGAVVVLDIDCLPDPASNTRGGARLARCTSVEDAGPEIRLSFIDMGPNSVAVVPSFGTPTQTSGLARSSITLPVTLNASGEPAAVEYAITDTSVGVRPADDSAAWTFEAVLPESATLVFEKLPAGRRVWPRARTQTQDAAGPKLPSAWVFPSPGYIDTDALPAPSGVTASEVSGTSARISFTPGMDGLESEVWLVQGAEEARALTLPAGSNTVLLFGLDESTSYTAKVRHRDASGGVSSFATVAFSTTATPPTAPRTVGLAVLVGRRV